MPKHEFAEVKAEADRVGLTVSGLARVVLLGAIRRGETEALMRRYPALHRGARRAYSAYDLVAMWVSRERGKKYERREGGFTLVKEGYQANAPRAWRNDKSKWWHLHGPGMGNGIPCAYQADEAKRIAEQLIQAGSQRTGDDGGGSRR